MPEGKFKRFCKTVAGFFKTTDFDVSVKNETMNGTVTKSEKVISVGIGQHGSTTNVKFEDNKISVSHDSVVAEDEKSDDTENV